MFCKLLIVDPIIEVGGQSSVLMPKYQSIFGDTGNETSWFVETEVCYKR
jgi:hypothetical protein